MSIRYDYFNTGDDAGGEAIQVTSWKAQTFTTTVPYSISSVKLKLFKNGSGTLGLATISIRATDGTGKPTGSDLTSGTLVANDVTTDTAGAWYEITFSSAYALTASTKYAIVARIASATSGYLAWKADTGAGYTGGSDFDSTNSGSTWTADTTDDSMFECWGDNTPPTDKIYSRGLVAIAGHEFWYESSAGTMEELTAANGSINTANPLTAIEAYQKIFVVNESNKKVADFVNTKIATASIGANLPDVGNTLTGGTSAAVMIVDFIDASSGATNVYGLRTTTATFSSGETVTGTNNAGSAVSFVLSAAETAPPHWYNWISYANDTTNYGTMLTNPTLIALYRGRIVIAGDSTLPNAWQMTKVAMPWKFLYDYTNDGDISAVTYTNTHVGQIGDIITALIAYKDDLMIFGCANSIWILVGDPLSSGQIARITNNTGIWGASAWCIDDKSNLYFLGEDGIYTMPISESYSQPENLTKLTLPNLKSDLDLDKSLHRVVLSFDPIKYGILVCKTTLSDGSNKNYWLDLHTRGFYDETYPNSCGVFSAYYYPATDDTYKKYLIGCNDGYIREFDNSTKNDATTSSTDAIDSYVALIGQLGEDEDSEGKLKWIAGITAGGATGGDFSDTDSVAYSIYVADDAETVLEDIKDAATAFATGTWTGTGKQNKDRIRARGSWYGIKLRNNTASETWSMDKIFAEIIPAGKGS